MDKFELITQNLQEVVGKQDLINLLNKNVTPIIYWGTACTGRIHIGYFIQILKIADYLRAGCKVKILLADLHAYLDNMKTSMKLLKYRTEYYKLMITEMLRTLNIDISQLEFVKGTDFQLTPEYTKDVYKLSSMTTYHEAKKAGCEVVKKSDNPTMTGLLYPILQALDEQYLGAYIQTGGVDQRKIMMFARESLPKIGYRKRMHLMTPMMSGLRFVKQERKLGTVITRDMKLETLKLRKDSELNDEYVDILYEKIHGDDINEFEDKMSASNNNSKLDLLDETYEVKKKINRAYCLLGDIEDNCLLDILGKVVFPILNYKNEQFVINRKEKFGGAITYSTYNDIVEDFKNEVLHPGDLKLGMIDTINHIFEPIRKAFTTEKQLLKKAYP